MTLRTTSWVLDISSMSRCCNIESEVRRHIAMLNIAVSDEVHKLQQAQVHGRVAKGQPLPLPLLTLLFTNSAPEMSSSASLGTDPLFAIV